MYFADDDNTARAIGGIFGRFLTVVLIYYLIYGGIRLFTKHTPNSRQKRIALITAFSLVLLLLFADAGNRLQH